MLAKLASLHPKGRIEIVLRILGRHGDHIVENLCRKLIHFILKCSSISIVDLALVVIFDYRVQVVTVVDQQVP